ncbi:MAG: hypothetical protein DMF85_19195 [Acidobacteria bacterium]|nr:MAG: hypothetical protein DMF85_19195 [Acidobacteriota bacterium]
MIRSKTVVGATHLRMPAGGQAEEHVIEPERTERRAPVPHLHGIEPSCELGVRVVVKSEPAIQIPTDGNRRAVVERHCERASLTRASRLREDPQMMSDDIREMNGDHTQRP